jgi:hypothetical protein
VHEDRQAPHVKSKPGPVLYVPAMQLVHMRLADEVQTLLIRIPASQAAEHGVHDVSPFVSSLKSTPSVQAVHTAFAIFDVLMQALAR